VGFSFFDSELEYLPVRTNIAVGGFVIMIVAVSGEYLIRKIALVMAYGLHTHSSLDASKRRD
jgi:hypothetical protein